MTRIMFNGTGGQMHNTVKAQTALQGAKAQLKFILYKTRKRE